MNAYQAEGFDLMDRVLGGPRCSKCWVTVVQGRPRHAVRCARHAVLEGRAVQSGTPHPPNAPRRHP